MRTLKPQPALKSYWIAIFQSTLHQVKLARPVISLLLIALFTVSAQANSELQKNLNISFTYQHGVQTQVELVTANANSLGRAQLADLAQKEIDFSNARNIPYNFIAMVDENNNESVKKAFRFSQLLKKPKKTFYVTIPHKTVKRHEAAQLPSERSLKSKLSLAFTRFSINGAIIFTTLTLIGSETPTSVAAVTALTTGLISGSFQLANQGYLDWLSYSGLLKVDKNKRISKYEFSAKYWAKEATLFLGLIAIAKHMAEYFFGHTITFDPANLAFGLTVGSAAATAFQGSYTALIAELRNTSNRKVAEKNNNFITGVSENTVFSAQYNEPKKKKLFRKKENSSFYGMTSFAAFNGGSMATLSSEHKLKLIKRNKKISDVQTLLASVISVGITVPILTLNDTLSGHAMWSAAFATLGIPALLYLSKAKKKQNADNKSPDFYNSYENIITKRLAPLSCSSALL